MLQPFEKAYPAPSPPSLRFSRSTGHSAVGSERNRGVTKVVFNQNVKFMLVVFAQPRLQTTEINSTRTSILMPCKMIVSNGPPFSHGQNSYNRRPPQS